MPTTLMGVNPEVFDHIRIQLKPQSRTVRHFDTSIRLNYVNVGVRSSEMIGESGNAMGVSK